jgi:hypothetical protein
MTGRWPLGAHHSGRKRDLKRAIPALALALALALAAPSDAARNIGLEVKGGSAVRNNGVITVWANSPEATLTLSNPGASFYQAKIQWLNVPTGAFLTTPQGVSDGASRNGTLNTSISVPGGSQGIWKLDPNLKDNFRFVVTGGGLGGLAKADQPNFAIHLGNSGLAATHLSDALKANPFPTYTLRGTRDQAKAFQTKLGKAPSAFVVNGTGFIFLDNASGRLSTDQHRWLIGRFGEFRESNVNRSFVFMHLPMVDPRKGRSVAMKDRDEVLKLLQLFKQNHVQTVFTGNLPLVNQTTWHGIPQVVVGGAYAMSVDVTPESVSVRRL